MDAKENYISSIGILPSSMPSYHQAYMAGRPSGTLDSANNHGDGEDFPRQQSSEEQAATVRRLKPHSRSQLNLDKTAQKPEGLTPITTKKPRQTKWQFGIRSRNQPLEAMACIYRALIRLGAEWQLEERKDDHIPERTQPDEQDRRRQDDSASDGSDEDGAALNRTATHSQRDSFGRHERPTPSGANNEHEPQVPHSAVTYLPEDPWIISCRWRKGGMYSPGAVPPTSAHSSTANLTAGDIARKRSSTVGSLGSATGSLTSLTGSTGHAGSEGLAANTSKIMDPNHSVYIYMEIQLYLVEKELHLVDFKCAGYERLFEIEVDDDEPTAKSDEPTEVSSPVHDLRTEAGGKAALDHVQKVERKLKKGLKGVGQKTEEKDVSSPFPFLDLASKLIIALADAE